MLVFEGEHPRSEVTATIYMGALYGMNIFLAGDRRLNAIAELTVGGVIIWTLLLLGSLIWNIRHEQQLTRTLAEQSARTHFDKDLALRMWATSHGGVYVPATEKTPPNPYLQDIPERDLLTPAGRRLQNQDFALL